MARVKVSKVPVSNRVAACVSNLVNETKDGANYAYAAGYLESSLVRVLEMLPPGKREAFLESMERNTKPKKTKVVRNLMSGEEVVIDADCPRSCDPSTELYWSM